MWSIFNVFCIFYYLNMYSDYSCFIMLKTDRTAREEARVAYIKALQVEIDFQRLFDSEEVCL